MRERFIFEHYEREATKDYTFANLMAMAPLKPEHAIEQVPNLLKLAARSIIPWHLKGIEESISDLKTINKNSSKEDVQAVYDATIKNAREAKRLKKNRAKKKSTE